MADDPIVIGHWFVLSDGSKRNEQVHGPLVCKPGERTSVRAFYIANTLMFTVDQVQQVYTVKGDGCSIGVSVASADGKWGAHMLEFKDPLDATRGRSLILVSHSDPRHEPRPARVARMDAGTDGQVLASLEDGPMNAYVFVPNSDCTITLTVDNDTGSSLVSHGGTNIWGGGENLISDMDVERNETVSTWEGTYVNSMAQANIDTVQTAGKDNKTVALVDARQPGVARLTHVGPKGTFRKPAMCHAGDDKVHMVTMHGAVTIEGGDFTDYARRCTIQAMPSLHRPDYYNMVTKLALLPAMSGSAETKWLLFVEKRQPLAVDVELGSHPWQGGGCGSSTYPKGACRLFRGIPERWEVVDGALFKHAQTHKPLVVLLDRSGAWGVWRLDSPEHPVHIETREFKRMAAVTVNMAEPTEVIWFPRGMDPRVAKPCVMTFDDADDVDAA